MRFSLYYMLSDIISPRGNFEALETWAITGHRLLPRHTLLPVCLRYPAEMLQGEINQNYGAIYENLVAQELYCHGFPMTMTGIMP